MRGKVGRFSRVQPFNVLSLSGLTAWWDASDSATLFDADSGGSAAAGDGEVGRLEDKSGSGRHFTQATSASRPTRKTSEQNGLDVLRFNGTSHRMVNFTTFANFFSATASTAFIVAKAQSVSTNSTFTFANVCVVSESDSGHKFVMLRSNDTAAAVGYDSTWRTASAAYEPGSWKVFSTLHSGGQLTFLINGSSSSQVDLSTRTLVGGVLRLGTNYAQTVFFSGDVGEIITFNVALSTPDREAVEAYLIDKWGVT